MTFKNCNSSEGSRRLGMTTPLINYQVALLYMANTTLPYMANTLLHNYGMNMAKYGKYNITIYGMYMPNTLLYMANTVATAMGLPNAINSLSC